MKYRSKETVEAVTFEEFVEIGLTTPGANIVNGVPWSFQYQGANVTHETDDRYLISGKDPDGALFNFDLTKPDFLVTASDGELYGMHSEWFHEKYEKSPDCWLSRREEEDPEGNVYVITPESDLEAIKRALEP